MNNVLINITGYDLRFVCNLWFYHIQLFVILSLIFRTSRPQLSTFCSSYLFQCIKIHYNKSVLLRERKRHTARRVASAPSVALSPDGGGEEGRVPPSSADGRYLYPVPLGGGVPPSIPDGGYLHPVMTGGTPSCPDGVGTPSSLDRGGLVPPSSPNWEGVPPSSPDRGTQSSPNGGYSDPVLMGVTPPPSARWGCPPSAGWGYPCQPDGGTPCRPDGGTLPPPPAMWTGRHLWKQNLPHSFGMRAVTSTPRISHRLFLTCLNSG